MTDQAQPVAANRSVITWRDAVTARAELSGAFDDGRPVFAVDARGRVVLANRAAAMFSGGAARFGQAVPPGGTVAALVARFASEAPVGADAFERTRAVLGLRASMLGLKLHKTRLEPLGDLTIVTFAEGVAPIPGEGGLLSDPLDPGVTLEAGDTLDPDVALETVATAAALDERTELGSDARAEAPALAGEKTATLAPAALVPAALASPAMSLVPTMEDPFSDASFATFSPVSFDMDDWTAKPRLPTQGLISEPARADGAIGADDLFDTDAVVDGLPRDDFADDDIAPVMAVARAVDAGAQTLAAPEAPVVEAPVVEVPVVEAPVVETGESGVVVAMDDAMAALPMAGDAIELGEMERATVADAAEDRSLDGVMALAALDGASEAEAIELARQAEASEEAETADELTLLDAAAPPVEDTVATEVEPSDLEADAPAQEALVPALPAFHGRPEPHRFVWQMDSGRRFTLVSRELADAVGRHGESLVGRTWNEVADGLRLDPEGRVETALARRDTWSGLTVMWPVAGAPVRVPVDLAALPSFGRNRSFDGYRGFGVCRTTDWQADPSLEIDTTSAPAIADAAEVVEKATPDLAPVAALAASTVALGALAPLAGTVEAEAGEGVEEPASIAEFADTVDVAASAPVDEAAEMAEAVLDAGLAPTLAPIPVSTLDTVADDLVPQGTEAGATVEGVSAVATDLETVAVVGGDAEADDTDPMLRRLNDGLHDAAHSAFDDDLEALAPAVAAVETPSALMDPDTLAHAEGTALPLDVAALTAPEAAISADAAAVQPAALNLPLDGAGLGDAVAELDDYLGAPEAVGMVSDAVAAQTVGLPTWHEAPRDEADTIEAAPAAISDGRIAAEPSAETVVDLTDGVGQAEASLTEAADEIGAAPAEGETPLEAALILSDVEPAEISEDPPVAATDVLEVAPDPIQPLVQGLAPDDRFGMMSPVVDVAPPLASPGDLAEVVDGAVTEVAIPDAAEAPVEVVDAEAVHATPAATDLSASDVEVPALEIFDAARDVAAPDEELNAIPGGAALLDVGAKVADAAATAPVGLQAAFDGVSSPVEAALDRVVDEAPARVETPALSIPARGERASLSEIAAALNEEMRAREAEATRAAQNQASALIGAAEVDVGDAADTITGSLADELVAFVPPPRPDNVIAAPIGPGAKVVTLPAGPRVQERAGERAPLSPPERDAFRQIARVLGARMEDEPAPNAARPVDPAPAALLSASVSDAPSVGEGADLQTDAVVAPITTDPSDKAATALEAIPDAIKEDTSGVVTGLASDAEARFVEARALTDLSIDNDEAAFVADAEVEALVAASEAHDASVEVDMSPLVSRVGLAADAGLPDEGADAAAWIAVPDDLVGDADRADSTTNIVTPDVVTPDIVTPDEALPAAALIGVSADEAPRRGASSEQPVLEEFPMAVAVVQGQDIPFANQAFLDLLGYGSLDDLNQAGGLEALFAGPHALKGWTGDASIRPLPAITRDGTVVPVCVRIAKTRWADAPALVMAMETAERAVAALTLPPAAPTREEEESARTAPTALVSGMGAEPREADELDPRARVAELEAVLDTATDGVAILNAEGTVVAMNRAGQALFGADATSLEGRKLVDLLAPESRRAAQDYLDGLARNGVQSLLNDGREVIALEAGGGLVPLFMTIGRLGEGRARAFCAVMRDITQWKKAEEELTAAKKHAELASLHKSDFLAKISHEIRTPLNAIMGFAEVMIDERFGPVGTERYKEYLKDIRTSGAHIMSLVNDLLDLSKIEAGKLDLKFEAVDLNAILRECVALMQPQANRERIIIRASLPTQVPPIVADSRSIRQIMLNLLSNAVKFTPAGGQVIVSTALEDQGQVALRVRDTGVGMTETEVIQALEPFRQVHTARSGAAGTGLGLPLTKALVEANRAAFAIRSTPGQGTLVEIVFPSTRVLAS